MDLLWPIVEIVKMIGAPIAKWMKHHKSLDKNMENLRRKLEELNSPKVDIKSELRVELCSGKIPKEEVEFWLREVRRINGEIQTLEEEIGKIKYLTRARLGKRVAVKIQEVEELHQKGSFSDGLVVDAFASSGEMLATTTLGGETTIKRNMEEIWDCLMNDEIRLIGVYGMGGSGKTTVMKHIYNKLLNETDKFDKVIWVTVSKVVDVAKLQDGIASALNEDLSRYEDETTRAAKLFAALRQKKRHVLVLDDVWEVFQLENVGIPEPTSTNGCKLVLTTRSLDVCRSMNCKDFKWKLLSNEEAWNLFLDKVGRDVLLTNPRLEATMKLVVEECACLPLAIVTIARSMKGVVDECEWRNALEELRESTGGLNDMGKVIEQLKYSYIRLKDEKLQHCLLYCALYPEDYEIERNELIEYLIVEGLLEGTSRQAEFDKGHSILNKLENACLLESVTKVNYKKCVKMHDLIRDMALQIMGRRCIVEASVHLKVLPDEDQWTENLERVSLMYNYIREIHFGTSPRCSRLATLLLSRNEILERIPDSFFVHMCGLKVLDLSDTRIEILPNSISDLENLTALLLRECWALKYVPSLAKLRALRTLDLSNTRIEEIPQGMEMLVNLRYLNLKVKYLKVLPVGVLPKLFRLQHLIVYWMSETLNVKGEEVAGLRKLETFAGKFYDLHNFKTYVRYLQGPGPLKYLLQVGSGDPLLDFDEEGSCFCKAVVLRKCSISGGEDPLALPNDTMELKIQDCYDASSLCDVLSSCPPLSSLEVLSLYELQNLHILFRGEGSSPPPPGTFSCLKKFHIFKCPNIKKLFMPGLLPHLQNLEEIYVRYCQGLKQIIATKEGGEEGGGGEGRGEHSNHSVVNNDDSITTITLPKLRRLYLKGLPELKSILCSRGTMICDSLRHIRVYKCPKLKRLPLFLPMLNGQPSPPSSLQEIWVNDREWWESLEWDHPTAKDVLQPFLNY